MLSNVKTSLETFAKRVTSRARANLTRNKMNVSKDLYNSLDYNKAVDLNVSKNSFSLSFYLEDYADFQDKGVSGTERKYNTPYSYKASSNLLGLEYHTGTFAKWAKFRGKQGRNKLGQFITYKQTGFMLASLIKKKGIKPTHFFTKPFEAAFKDLPSEVVDAFGLDLNNIITE